MKKAILIIFISFLTCSLVSKNIDGWSTAVKASALTDSQHVKETNLCNLYASVGGVFGTSISGSGLKYTINGFSINAILSNNWGVSFCYRQREALARNFPADYKPATRNIYKGLIFPVYSGTEYVSETHPKDKFNSYSFMLVREGCTDTKMVRFGVELGPSLVTARIVNFERQPITQTMDGNSSNYKLSYTYPTVLGLCARAKMEFPLTMIGGLELALAGHYNKFYNTLGLEVYFTFGLVREKLNAPSKNKIEW